MNLSRTFPEQRKFIQRIEFVLCGRFISVFTDFTSVQNIRNCPNVQVDQETIINRKQKEVNHNKDIVNCELTTIISGAVEISQTCKSIVSKIRECWDWHKDLISFVRNLTEIAVSLSDFLWIAFRH